MDAQSKFVIVGGGIAGLSAACALARVGAKVELLEAEDTLCAHSSGRNAAIFRCLDLSAGAASLALRSARLHDELVGARERWLDAIGVLYVAGAAAPLQPLIDLAREHRIPHRLLEGSQLHRLAPFLEGTTATHGLLSPTEGVMDTDAIQQALVRAIRATGGQVRVGARVLQLEKLGNALESVALVSGETVKATGVVLAAGAWAAELGAGVGAPLPLAPLRRHLALLAPPAAPSGPVVWRVDDEVYFRPESGGVLASPCDESRAVPGVPPAEPNALVLLGRKLAQTAPGLADSGVRRSWAGLRTFAPDRAVVVGADPRVQGLLWLAGLGGHGMSVAAGAGELLAASISGRRTPLALLLSPQRLDADQDRPGIPAAQ